MLCLLHCSHGRESNNYAQYQQTRAPPDYPSGGGFSILRLSIGALYEDLEKFRNYWTKTNENLDLIRYTGMSLTFYRHQYVSYIVTYSLCNPMTLSKISHMNTHPYRQLLNKNKIIVPSLQEAPLKKKLYIKKKLQPPKQMVNKWFFQRDFADVGLVLIHIASISLNHMYQATNSKNTTVSLFCLNHKVFKNNDFANATGYRPNNEYWYWGQDNKHQWISLLGITHDEGQTTTTANSLTEKSKWGNLFWHSWLHKEGPIAIKPTNDTSKPPDQNYTRNPHDLIVECRYNPYSDKGTGNKIYLVSTLGKEGFLPPSTQHDFYIEGYPLWLMWYGWLDWCVKLRPGAQIDINYTAVFQSPYLWPEQPYYCPINRSMYNNEGPWGTPIDDISLTQYSHWYPRVANQVEAINNICCTGPAIPKAENITSWEHHCKYKAYIKWGGCPTPYVQIEDPSKQPKYPAPDNILLRSQIQDLDNQSPQNIIYSWDFKRGIVTEDALQRITKDVSLTDSLRKPSKRTTDAPIQTPSKIQKLLQEAQETSSEEEEEIPLQQQLRHQRFKQQRLKQRLLNLIQKLEKQQQKCQRYITPIT